MTADEAKLLLPLYADGLLDGKEAARLESVLAERPDLREELKKLREENQLITDALAPLNPSRSSRIKLSEAMQQIYRRAEYVAEKMPKRDWRIFRILFAILAVAGFAYIFKNHPLPEPLSADAQEQLWQTYPTPGGPPIHSIAPLMLGVIAPLAIGVFLLIGAEFIAHAETWFMAKLLGKHVERTRLQVLMMEVFGFTSIAAAAIIYLCMLKM